MDMTAFSPRRRILSLKYLMPWQESARGGGGYLQPWKIRNFNMKEKRISTYKVELQISKPCVVKYFTETNKGRKIRKSISCNLTGNIIQTNSSRYRPPLIGYCLFLLFSFFDPLLLHIKKFVEEVHKAKENGEWNFIQSEKHRYPPISVTTASPQL